MGATLLFSLAGCGNDEEEVEQLQPEVLAIGTTTPEQDEEENSEYQDVEDPEHQKVRISEDSLATALELLEGQWEMFKYVHENSASDASEFYILTFTKDGKYTCPSRPEETGDIEIYQIYKLDKSSSYSLSCLIKHLDLLGQKKGAYYYDLSIEGDTLHIKEQYLGTEFNSRHWYFKKQ